MPKFLDAPSWYDAGGRETEGWGLTPYYPQGDFLSNLPTGRYLLVGPSGAGLASQITLNIQNGSGSYSSINISAGTGSWNKYGNSRGVPCIMTVYNDINTTGALNLFFENVMSDSSTYGAIVPSSCGIYRGARMYLHFTQSGSGYNLTDSWGLYAGSTNGYSIYNGSLYVPQMAGYTGMFLRSVGGGGPSWDDDLVYRCGQFTGASSANLYINHNSANISTNAYSIFLWIFANGTIESVSLNATMGGTQEISGFSNASRAAFACIHIPSSAGSRTVYVNGMKSTTSSVTVLNSTVTGVSSAVDRLSISLSGTSTVGSYLMCAVRI